MEYVDVQGARIPKIGLGTWQLDLESCRGVVETALEAGYRHIDCAQAYGNESKVGGALQASDIPRDELWITTKLGLEHLTRDEVARSTHESLRRLGLEYLDLLLIHWPSSEVPLRETLEAMRKLQESGEVLHLGVSNFTPSLLEEALQIAPILCNQVEYHPFLGQDRLRALAERHELLLTAYSPLAHGRVPEDATLKQIGEAHGKNASQVALRWLVQQSNVAAVPKASSAEHLSQNISIFDFELDADEAHQIAQLERGERLIDPEWAPQWGR